MLTKTSMSDTRNPIFQGDVNAGDFVLFTT